MNQVQDFPLLPCRFRDLNAHPRNAEIYSQQQVADLPESVAEFGVLHDPVVHQRTDGSLVILSGHRRIDAALAAGKTLDDTILCRVLRGLTEWDERAILIHANKQRQKTHAELMAERHELIAIGRELGQKRASQHKRGKGVFSGETPQNLSQAAQKVGLSVKAVRRISTIFRQINLIPSESVQKEARAAFDLGKYSLAQSILETFWNANPEESGAKLWRLRKAVQNSEKSRLAQSQQIVTAQKLEIAMLRQKIGVLQRRVAELEKQLGSPQPETGSPPGTADQR